MRCGKPRSRIGVGAHPGRGDDLAGPAPRAGCNRCAACRPDLTTFGKYIGGGMSVRRVWWRAEIIYLFDPRRPDALPHLLDVEDKSC